MSIIKEGWVKKEGGKRKTWKDRWLTLYETHLSYYSKARMVHEDKPKADLECGSIELASITEVRPPAEYKNISTPAFSLATPARVYYVTYSKAYGTTANDLADWAEAIKKQLAAIKGNGSGGADGNFSHDSHTADDDGAESSGSKRGTKGGLEVSKPNAGKKLSVGSDATNPANYNSNDRHDPNSGSSSPQSLQPASKTLGTTKQRPGQSARPQNKSAEGMNSNSHRRTAEKPAAKGQKDADLKNKSTPSLFRNKTLPFGGSKDKPHKGGASSQHDSNGNKYDSFRPPPNNNNGSNFPGTPRFGDLKQQQQPGHDSNDTHNAPKDHTHSSGGNMYNSNDPSRHTEQSEDPIPRHLSTAERMDGRQNSNSSNPGMPNNNHNGGDAFHFPQNPFSPNNNFNAEPDHHNDAQNAAPINYNAAPVVALPTHKQEEEFIPVEFPEFKELPMIQYNPREIQRDIPHIAKGSFGIVYTGHVPDVTEKLVIKDMTVMNEGSVNEWKKELVVMSANSCPYICRVYGYAQEKKTLTIVMEYMELGDLFSILENPASHPLSVLQKMRMARHIALGIDKLHSNGIIHRDIKSMNVLVTEDYSCKLADFGTAKLSDSNSMMNTMNAGTPLWMAPEVKRGVYGQSADIYSFGIVLFELFYGPLLPFWNPQTQSLRLPYHFKSAPLVLPCINANPMARPSAMQISQHLDWLTNRICVIYQTNLSKQEAEQLRAAAIQTGVTTEAEILKSETIILYRHLLKQLPQIVDNITDNVFQSA